MATSDDARPDDSGARRAALTRVALFSAITVMIAIDLHHDYQEGSSWAHIGLELVILSLAAVGAALGWRRYLDARDALVRVRADLAAVRDRAEHWRAENQALVQGLGAAIAGQFREWELTAAETEVGLLLLKGLSLKELADARGTSERTAREQARAVYRKAGLAGRAELSAFFLEDLLVSGMSTDDGAADEPADASLSPGVRPAP